MWGHAAFVTCDQKEDVITYHGKEAPLTMMSSNMSNESFLYPPDRRDGHRLQVSGDYRIFLHLSFLLLKQDGVFTAL